MASPAEDMARDSEIVVPDYAVNQPAITLPASPEYTTPGCCSCECSTRRCLRTISS